jgi:hypothetical protein
MNKKLQLRKVKSKMDARTLLNKICDESDKDAKISMEFPSLCGNSDISRCKGHGHLALSVTKQTVQEVAFNETHTTILITIPKDLLKQITTKDK